MRVRVLLGCFLFVLGGAAGFVGIHLFNPGVISHLPLQATQLPPQVSSGALDKPHIPSTPSSIETSAIPGGTDSAGSTALELVDILQEKDRFKRAAENYEFVQRLDAKGLQAALGSIATMRQGTQQIEMEQLLLKKLAQTDPTNAVATAMSIPNAHAALVLADPLFRDWLKKDSASAWTWANNLPDGIGRNRLLGSALAVAAKADPASAVGYILQISTQPGTEIIYRTAAAVVAKNLAKSDPAAMAKFVSQLPESPAKAGALCAGADQLAQTDPKAAADLLSTGRPSIDTTKELVAVMDIWGEKDMPSAIAYASGLSGRAETEAMALLVPALAKTDPKSAIEVATKLNNGEVTGQLLYELPEDLKIENADQAMTAAAAMPGNLKNDFLERSAMAIVEKDPLSASRLLEQIPDGPVRNSAMQNVVIHLGHKDFATAQSYVQSLPAGAKRDAGVTALIVASYNYPDRATQLALTYADNQIRNVQLPRLYSRWLKTDPTAAQTWLAQAPLDETTRQKLTNPK